jgi:hypothetical protein
MELPNWTADQAAAVQAGAAVVQTIAAVVALFVAVGVPSWQSYLERKQKKADRETQARALVCMATPDLLVLRQEIDEAEEIILHGGPRAGMPKLDRPPALATAFDRIHVLGGLTGILVMRLFRCIDCFNRARDMQSQLAQVNELRACLDRLADALTEIWPGNVSTIPPH